VNFDYIYGLGDDEVLYQYGPTDTETKDVWSSFLADVKVFSPSGIEHYYGYTLTSTA